MATGDYKQVLKDIELFAGAKSAELAKLVKASKEVTFAAGEQIIDQGAVGRDAYFILSGSAGVRRGTRKIATLGPGDPVGELALLDRGPRSAHVTAETEVRALRLTAKAFDAVLAECPDLSRRLLATLAGRVRNLDRKLLG